MALAGGDVNGSAGVRKWGRPHSSKLGATTLCCVAKNAPSSIPTYENVALRHRERSHMLQYLRWESAVAIPESAGDGVARESTPQDTTELGLCGSAVSI